jgi:hypothetical protein
LSRSAHCRAAFFLRSFGCLGPTDLAVALDERLQRRERDHRPFADPAARQLFRFEEFVDRRLGQAERRGPSYTLNSNGWKALAISGFLGILRLGARIKRGLHDGTSRRDTA